jgi:putative transcriptional regulator
MNGAKLDLSFGGHLRRIRRSLGPKWFGLTQAEFAKRFGLAVGTVRDAEQGRVRPSLAMQILVAAIEIDPSLIDRAVILASERRRLEDGASAGTP